MRANCPANMSHPSASGVAGRPPPGTVPREDKRTLVPFVAHAREISTV